jgi:hypothetical protein
MVDTRRNASRGGGGHACKAPLPVVEGNAVWFNAQNIRPILDAEAKYLGAGNATTDWLQVAEWMLAEYRPHSLPRCVLPCFKDEIEVGRRPSEG